MKIEPPEIFSSGLKENISPIATKKRYISPQNREFVKEEIERLLESGIIEKSCSPWRAQAFVVRNQKPRMVIDYSETINLFTHLDAYPFTNLETILNNVAENSYFSKLDLKSAYHQVPIHSNDRPYTAFEADGDLYQFTRLPFGLTNAVPIFQRIMDEIIKNYGLQKAYPYLDDITICGSTKEEHDDNLRKFMEVSKAINLTLNEDKCLFGVQRISLLGHIIENGTKRPDPDRLRGLTDLPNPTNIDQLNRMIGFFAYYSKWINDYSNKIKSLLDTQKSKQFPLSSTTITVIQILKDEISKASLAIPESNAGHLILETDASGSAIGATLSQAGRPIGFFSRTLSNSEQQQSTVEREAMAIIEATRKWSEYLHLFPTLIKTDQKAVSYIFSKTKSRVKNDKLARWRLELSEFHYDIIYRKGSENLSADTLSRVASCSIIETVSLSSLHEALAHPGITRMWEYVRRHNLSFSLDDVRKMTAECQTCCECKPTFFNPNPRSHLIKSTRTFERLNVDIVGPKAASRTFGNKYLLVIIDEYSRFPMAFPLKDITSQALIRCFKQLFAIFGTPDFIHSDRGAQFMSEEFDNFLIRYGISHSRTTPYNPRGNGQTERFNGVIWKSIQCLIHSRKLSQSMWEEVLPEALATNRSLICTSTNQTPHSRMFQFDRKGTQGFSLPDWLRAGQDAYVRNFVRNKNEPLVIPVNIIQVINPYFARIRFSNGREDTVSTRALSRGPSPHQSSDDNMQQSHSSDTDEALNESRPTRNRYAPERFQP